MPTHNLGRRRLSGAPSPRRSRPPLLTPGWVRLFSVLAFTGIYAACFALIKAGLAFAPPLWFAGLRALIGGLALLGLVLLVRAPLFPAPRQWPGLLALAAFSTTIGFGAMFLSPGRTGAGLAAVLGNMQPLVTVILAAVFLGEQLTRRTALALGLGLIGVILIAYPALVRADAAGVGGAALALAASAGTAAGSVIAKRMNLGPDLLAGAAWQLILGSLPLFAGSALVEQGARVRWNGEFVALLLFLALIGTSFATALWYWLLQREAVGRLTLFLFLVPVVGLGIGAFVLGEPVSLVAGGGAVLIILGIGTTSLGGTFHHATARKVPSAWDS